MAEKDGEAERNIFRGRDAEEGENVTIFRGHSVRLNRVTVFEYHLRLYILTHLSNAYIISRELM
jgi:hypothetical protein